MTDTADSPTVAQRSERVVLRRGIGYLVGSILVPGSAQLVGGNRRVGVVALRVIGALLGLVIVLGLVSLVWRTPAVTLLASGWFWKRMQWVLIVLGVCWAALVLDAWRVARPMGMAPRSRLGFGIGALLLAMAVFFGSLGLGSMARAQGDLLSKVFAGGGSRKATAGRINVLLLGGDAGADRTGLRPDSITVASISEQTGRTVLFSLPRNLEDVDFPPSSPLHKLYPHGYSCPDHSCLLNAVYMLGQDHKDLYPGVADPGVQATKEAVEQTLGLSMNYYAMIDLQGFISLIDAVGGITLDVNKRVPIGGGTSKVFGYIEVGKNKHLDGYHALWFARSRHGSTDYERMIRQKCVMNAMLNQLNPATVVVKFNDIAHAGQQIAATDVPASEVNRLMTLATKAKAKPISSVSFTPPLIYPGNPKLAVIRQTVKQRISASEALDDPSRRSSTPGSSGTSGSTNTSGSDGSTDTSKSTGAAGPSGSAGEPGSSSSPTTAAGSGSSAKPTAPASDDNGTPQPQNDDLSQVCAVS
ncbi:LCP family glycopolymer transferase [Aestuariimicrobium sp. T2.26MG-19.2B]|uniref:LCP family glycopolymer transferase n=1 Tax=Aestuariimicrobium sp. T2.26MG-19.2B TaxID=3040679 RepID=UPI0024773F02|nr:LCP family protein [Aestuariimicrobium sp. T2.26MG-19.2B]CAI9407424.1 Polyisoprenyl-teichoic acid--peptidoglycan teichoic acid transferase TagU [Aestuariimicrobium sp. T2.26MG-19.2B]